MAIKPSRSQLSLSSRLSLREDKPWWRSALDRCVWVGMTLIVVALVSQWLAWPLLGPYKPFVHALKAERDAKEQANGAINASLIKQVSVEERSTRDALTIEMASLREENLRLKADLLSLRRLKGAQGIPATFTLKDLKIEPTSDPYTFHWQVRVLSSDPELQTFRGSLLIRLKTPSGERVSTSSMSRHLADTEGTLTIAYTDSLNGVFKIEPGVRPSIVTAELWKTGDRTPVASIRTPFQP